MRLNKNIIKHIGLLTIVLFLVSCKGDDETNGGTENFDRKAMLANLSDHIILPAYDSLVVAANELHDNAVALSQSVTTEHIQNLRNSWKHTLVQWQFAGVYDFGPASDYGLVSVFNLYPVSTTHIEDNIASGNYNLESAANINAVGLEAMDYLLYGIESDASNLATFFSENPGHLNYILDNTELLKTKAQTVLDLWNGSYSDTFKNATGTDIGSSLGQVVNSAIQYLEIHIRDAKIGIPAGARSSTGMPLPGQVEAYYNGSVSKEMLINGIQGWQNMFNGNARNGDQGTGLDDYLKFLGTSFDGNPLHEEINGRFNNARTLTQDLNEDLKLAVVTEQDACMEIFEELQRTIVLVKVDMTSAMGIQITYVDNDGD